ncbi:hypothetical protein EIP91_011356 [Steccherinum ochraceum]|uniref:Amidohydrolase-related domain-containing protein n=1 Tax=Steccherinum ochraceum TaxID=92696 RepID=A0A4R0RPV3_9APHY|nr:hypothetical protein EIP91_011356 [Steccherinum ochraceum]
MPAPLLPLKKLPRRIDVHHHIFPPSLMQSKLEANDHVGWRTPPENLPWTPELSLDTMDALGIDTAVLSFPAGVLSGPPGPESCAQARELNIMASKICQDHPGRFGFFACLPDPTDELGALDELIFALDHLHADGVSLSSSYGQGADAKYIGDEAYDPLWKELNRRGCVVFLHGAQTPSSTPYPHPFLGLPITEVPNETFKAAAHLVVSGKKRMYPNVRIILAHLGGSVPFLTSRVAVLSGHMGCPLSPEEIMEDFKTFYFETALSASETTLTAMKSFVGPEKMLFGTDFPAVSRETISWYTEELDKFYAGSDDDARTLEEINYQNAMRLFPRLFICSVKTGISPPRRR